MFRPVSEHIAVEVGWVHPMALGSVISLFARDRFFLFFGAVDRLEVVRGPVVFSSADHLIDVKVAASPPVAAIVSETTLAPVEIPIRLVPTTAPPRRVVGALIDWADASRLKQLVYVLPPPTLRGHTVALTDRDGLYGAEGDDQVACAFAAVGGTLDVRSQPERGTTLIALVPTAP